jgi:hypothetical protein
MKTLSRRSIVMFLAASSILGTRAQAAEKLLSLELEFDNAVIRAADYGGNGDPQYPTSNANEKWMSKWGKYMKKRCEERGDCYRKKVEGWTVWDGYETWLGKNSEDGKALEQVIEYDNGFKFTISMDVAVIEVKVGPFTESQWKKYETLLQTEIYDTAKALGLQVQKDAMAHVTMGAKQAFGGSLLKYRNYLVNMANHPEMDIVMNIDFSNAPPLAFLPEKSHQAFEKIIAEVDSGKITSIEQLSRAMNNRVYNVTFDMAMVDEYDPAEKFQAVNLDNMEKSNPLKQRFERRSSPTARGGEDCGKLIRLNVAELDYIEAYKGRMPLEGYMGDLAAKDGAERFASYMKKLKLPPGDYLPFFTSTYRNAAKKMKDYCATRLKPGRG